MPMNHFPTSNPITAYFNQLKTGSRDSRRAPTMGVGAVVVSCYGDAIAHERWRGQDSGKSQRKRYVMSLQPVPQQVEPHP